jgi:hypothetical protein
MLYCRGRKLTNYVKALQPFAAVDEHGKVEVGLANNGTCEDIVVRFWKHAKLALEKDDPSQFALFLFRALAYGQWRMDNAPTDDSLLDAFLITFAGIQILSDRDRFSSLQERIETSIEAAFRAHGTDFSEKASRGDIATNIPPSFFSKKQLIWCLCDLCLTLNLIVREKVDEKVYDLLLPNPYGKTTTEILKIAHLGIECRPQGPESYRRAYTAIMDNKDFMPVGSHDEWFAHAYSMAKRGKATAEEIGDPFYRFTFQMIELLWMPTPLWTTDNAPITVKEAHKLRKHAYSVLGECLSYVPDFFLLVPKNAEGDFKAFLKEFKVGSNMKVPSFPNMYIYFTARFGRDGYYKPGGKFDQLPTYYCCSNCSNQLLTSLRCCSACKKTIYCGKACQVEHWKKGHKEECKKNQSASST